jgi:hypothetical protein
MIRATRWLPIARMRASQEAPGLGQPLQTSCCGPFGIGRNAERLFWGCLQRFLSNLFDSSMRD